MSASSTSTSSQWDIDVPEDVVHQAVANFGNFLSKEEMSEMVATPEDLARLETVGNWQADQQCLALWNFHWSKHQHNYCKVNNVLDSSLVILDLHSTLLFLKSEITN